MSIIYNDQVVAGKYTQQVVADADTVNSGIIKIATQEEVNEGVDNTTAVTPFYLAQKQNKIEAGDGIVIDSNNVISCTANPDEETIKRKGDGTMQCVGQLTKSNTLKFDWEGTQAEYTNAMLNGEIQPDWYCYITDDESIVDYADVCNQSLSNLRPEGEARFEAKADKATTLEGYGITDGLSNNQITNCLLEVPQNIKLELNNGTLTLKAGSKVIVPNGSGVFEELIITSDVVRTYNWVPSAGTDQIVMVYVYTNGTNLDFRTTATSYSGTTQPTGSSYQWYDTTNNKVIRHDAVQTSFPIAIITQGGNGVTKSIDQVFNGLGYIGNTIFCDKGVKGLIPNGRNIDGSLNNIEFTTSQIMTRTLTATFDAVLGLKSNYIGQLNIKDYSFDYKNNYCMNANASWGFAIIGSFIETNGVISNFQLKQPFRAVDYNELNQTVNKIEDNLSTKLNESQITNCLLEVPQRIKYTLENGTLTIKAGSVVIVPYGTTNRTSEFPVGSQFLNSNFKVVDVQFASGQFFVWVELVNDVTSPRKYDQDEIMYVTFNSNELQGE